MMRRLLNCLALATWPLVSSLSLALFWIRSPTAWVPIPEWIWTQVEKRVEIRCCEHAANVEYFVVLAAAMLTMVAVTALAWALLRGLRRR
ncbi:hypothetical protein [Achromobacter sp.]|uniref:hypothetical protein n=1 Tax=Achromobacter sp. TaxID=134375 RepID=UPI0028AD88C5|nr:hypothetical protein [Achromobacter sp.]